METRGRDVLDEYLSCLVMLGSQFSRSRLVIREGLRTTDRLPETPSSTVLHLQRDPPRLAPLGPIRKPIIKQKLNIASNCLLQFFNHSLNAYKNKPKFARYMIEIALIMDFAFQIVTL